MDLSLTENQEMLRNSAREFIQREYSKEILLDLDDRDISYTQEIWDRVAGIGWLGILIPQEYGGEGGSLTDAGVLLHELGRGPVPGPIFSSSVLGAMVVLEGGTEAQKQAILPAVARGTQTLALAVTEEDYGWVPGRVRMTTTRSRRHGNFVLNGVKLFVHDADAASHLICAVRTRQGSDPAQGISLLVVDKSAPGVSVRNLPGPLLGQVTEVKFDSVEVPESALLGGETGGGWEALERASHRAIPVLCAYKVGGCEAVFEMSVLYSQTRVQFGVPIGRFQRVQDQIINLVNHLDSARWTTYEVLWKLDTGRPAADAVHLAKAVSSEAYYQACNYAHETHAGIGVMKEYGLTLHTKMSRTLYHYLGDPRFHKRKMMDALDL
jgi:alkylation response protein AidB-like acyl-CoA dehydrogenase